MTLISLSLSTRRSLSCLCPTRVYYQPLAKAIHLAQSIKSIQDNSESVFRIGPWMLEKGHLSLLGVLAVSLAATKILWSRKATLERRNTRPTPRDTDRATCNMRTPESQPLRLSFHLFCTGWDWISKGPGGKGTCLMQPSTCSPNTQVSETHN